MIWPLQYSVSTGSRIHTLGRLWSEVDVRAGSAKCTKRINSGVSGPAEPVRFLQVGTVRGREAREAGVVVPSSYSKLQSFMHSEWRGDGK